jgi:hypothetical protein
VALLCQRFGTAVLQRSRQREHARGAESFMTRNGHGM